MSRPNRPARLRSPSAFDGAASGIEEALGGYAEGQEQPPTPGPRDDSDPLSIARPRRRDRRVPPRLETPDDRPAADGFARRYTAREVGLVLAVFAASMLLLGSEGLLSWAHRLDLGPAQEAWLSVLTPVYRATDAIGLTAPRRAVASTSARIARALGAGQDPLFEEAWKKIGEIPVEPFDEGLDDWSALEPIAEPMKATVEGKITVLLVGDSMMAGSLGAALENALVRNRRFRVVRAHQIGTGLARTEVFDWMGVVAPLIERERPQLVICSLGANDGQRIRHRGELLNFGDAAWNVVYRKRVRALMQTLAGTDARVLWLGLPPMRSQGLTHRMRHLNRIFASSAKRVPRVDYMELGMLLTGRDEGFATFIRDDDGKLLRVRMEDGVHYSPAGARRVARWVVDWVHEQVRQRRPISG